MILIVSFSVPNRSFCGTIELVESYPVETSLDSNTLSDTHNVWRAMIQKARQSIEIETFYFSEDPENRDRLDLIVEELRSADNRDVAIRTISDAGFDETYPSIRTRLEAFTHAETRTLDVRSLWGGVLHAKYFIVDSLDLFVGSQNWDWRALEHIRELGVRIIDKETARAFAAIFQYDWDVAGGTEPPSDTVYAGPFMLKTVDGDTVAVQLAASPDQARPAGIPWDEPMILSLLDAATETIRVHLLTYSPMNRDGTQYGRFDTAIRRAAARGVDVRMIVSDWSKRSSILPHIQSLSVLPGIHVRFTAIPEWSGGFIPYSRVEHPKYLVVDGTSCWIGTSNWNPGSFHTSRNIGLIIQGKTIAEQMAGFFDLSWNSRYAEPVDPCGEYSAPRRTH
jgi:phosphatidylserine/phosphatidylglycerophosphate/cardiolipin synthase-like enzyme